MRIEDVIIDEGFQEFLPSLHADERAALKEEILEDGFTDPLIVWQNHGELIDGYNRYDIWLELGADPDKAPDIIERKFADRAAVMEWMFHHQFARRNMTAAQRAAVALKMKPAFEERAKANEKAGGGDKKSEKQGEKSGSTNSSNPIRPVDTRKEIAAIAGVSEDTVRKTETVLKHGKKSTKKKMLDGEISANQAFNETKAAKPKADKVEEKPSPSKSIKTAGALLAKVEADFIRAADNLAPLVRTFDEIKSGDPNFKRTHEILLGHHSRLFQICEDGKRVLKALKAAWDKK